MRRAWLLFISNPFISIAMCAILGFIYLLARPFPGSVFGNVFMWFYELPIALILLSAGLSLIIKKDIALMRRIADDPASRLAAEWILKGFGSGFAFFFAISMELVKIRNAFMDMVDTSLIDLILTYLFLAIIPFVILPSIFLLRIYQRQKMTMGHYLFFMLKGLASFCMFMGFVLMILFNLILLALLFLGMSGLRVF